VVITVAAITLFRFPPIPGFLGGLLNFAVILFGLGALWLWGSECIPRRQPAAQEQTNNIGFNWRPRREYGAVFGILRIALSAKCKLIELLRERMFPCQRKK
jgi:hypothetical protein